MGFDVVIKNGLYFDGTGEGGQLRNIGVRGGRVAAVSRDGLDESGARVIDARGMWIVPGFVDIHTHYDAELLAAPSLSESIRHGVTTVTVGSCSISTILSDAEDCSDLFTRVEAIPRSYVLPLLRDKKSWRTPAEYVEFLDNHPLGPNVTSFLGHSDLRTSVMGLGRALDASIEPTEAEVARMERTLEDAIDCGMLGLSTMTNPWDKLDGDRYRSAALPSTYASWGEYRRLHRILRRRGRILQSAPNITTKVNAIRFLLESAPWGGDKALKTTLITLADAKTSPGLHRVLAGLTRFVNRVLGGDFRWQTLPTPFEVYADGIDLVVFEEFGAGEEALHLAEEVARNELLKDEQYRRRFRKDYQKKLSPRVWQRDFYDAFIVGCPDERLVGRSIGAVADERGIHPVDAFLDLVVEHGKLLRWRTTIANHRPREVARMISEPGALIGFADSGAHIRNMAFYNFPLRMLKLVRDAERAGKPIMPIEKAIWRLTGELGSWLGIEAGTIRLGDRADLSVLDPSALDDRLEVYHEAPMDGFDGLARMVNRSDGAVRSVLVNGRVAFGDGAFEPALGRERGFGQFLRAGQAAERPRTDGAPRRSTGPDAVAAA
ncbi:MAG: amidohydrolase family protein [Polyangiaceae bacterium]|nr:amidohydrolase family protein [Polyangiaceae bacterium]